MTQRMCARCVLYAGMRFALLHQQVPAHTLARFDLDSEGVCTLCRAWERAFDAKRVDADLAHFLLAHDKRSSAPHAVVALSGGKDSLATLVYLRTVARVPVVAALFDNGFIPADVRAQAERVCAALDVELWIDRAPADFAADLHAAVEGAAIDRELPCFTCSRRLLTRIATHARDRGARFVAVGTNYHASWNAPASTSSTEGTSQAPRALGPTGVDGITRIHVPFAARLTRADVLTLVARAGAEVKTQARGHSSNCAVPGLVQLKLAPSLGHAPEREDLALEVISGHLTRAEALSALDTHGG